MTNPAAAPPPTKSPKAAITTLIVISMLALGFISWLLLVHHAIANSSNELSFLAPLEACFNGFSAVAILMGVRYIRRRKITAHRNSMITAFVFSSLFLITYIVHHTLRGDIIFAGHGAIRIIYLAILISHIVLSAFALPLILIAFFLAFTRRFSTHRKITPITYAMWLYVSVTGVVVYVMLAVWR